MFEITFFVANSNRQSIKRDFKALQILDKCQFKILSTKLKKTNKTHSLTRKMALIHSNEMVVNKMFNILFGCVCIYFVKRFQWNLSNDFNNLRGQIVVHMCRFIVTIRRKSIFPLPLERKKSAMLQFRKSLLL